MHQFQDSQTCCGVQALKECLCSIKFSGLLVSDKEKHVLCWALSSSYPLHHKSLKKEVYYSKAEHPAIDCEAEKWFSNQKEKYMNIPNCSFVVPGFCCMSLSYGNEEANSALCCFLEKFSLYRNKVSFCLQVTAWVIGLDIFAKKMKQKKWEGGCCWRQGVIPPQLLEESLAVAHHLTWEEAAAAPLHAKAPALLYWLQLSLESAGLETIRTQGTAN